MSKELMRVFISGCISVSLCVLAASLAANSQVPGEPQPGAQAVPFQSSPSPASGGSAGGSAIGGTVSVAPGPLEDQRKALLDKITMSKKLGFGTGPYMAAFSQIESMVKSGAPADTIQKRIDSVRSSLFEQVKRIKDIKERPPMAPSMVSSHSNASDGPGMPGATGNGQQMLDQLKKKFGGQLPSLDNPGMREKLSDPALREKLSDPETREKLMQSPLGQKLLERFQGQ